MEYRKGPGGEPISALGYGCMRFTKKGGSVDLDKAERELMAAIDGGVNYLDTAYIYGGNEAALGEILTRTGARSRVNLATKLPQYLIKSAAAPDRYFREQLKRLQTDRIDYYLMHMLTDVASWEKLVRLGIEDWIAEKKASGQIRHIGFSYHGDSEMFVKLLDVYPWDFCQIQYNYMDEHSQAGRRGLQEAARRNIPVIIMEPLRGGSLTDKLPEAARALFETAATADEDAAIKNSAAISSPAVTPAAASDGAASTATTPGQTAQHQAKVPLTPASLALRWLFNQPEVTCVLSGMHSMDMVKENLAAASMSPPGCLTEEEGRLIELVKAAIAENTLVGCTGCGYCLPCPCGVDIPGIFRCYNVSASESKATAWQEYMRNTLMRKEPSGAYRCIGCGKCQRHCPQGIEIPAQLHAARALLETPLYTLARKALQIYRLW